ncbi:5'-methylthioadenosine phosphorylase [Marinobacter panjinensis]|uniref:5'-methylthioadenosine phosphorylase n=1 Tax=Marinobacter panjinensis TaxID=2576384 RepID=A0A4U6R2B1_9GAMM|nr:CsiV family protein [Marinobacter panjinensis]MCR8913851.1 peptidoglycan binding protein CsiV [Marinobacter panjinensis]TKV67511.1 5'-methylthioadenosine phosphorylase [Marinobacter panjinensis]
MNNRNIGAKPLRTPGNLLLGKSTFIFAVALALSPLVSAQQTSGQAASAEAREDYYRAEFVILERKVEPGAINERMASRIPEPPNPDVTEILRAVDGNGTVETTRDLVPRSELHLNSAANRLENSGRYRILLAAGWYQSFPPDFEGEPLRVAIGDWLAEAGQRDVEGHITIDRQRYLHVDVHLNHWQPMPRTEETVDVMASAPEEEPLSDTGETSDEGIESISETAVQPEQAAISGINRPRAELLTWIRETRRMRSEEVHFLDSPTIGVLVFFKKIEE